MLRPRAGQRAGWRPRGTTMEAVEARTVPFPSGLRQTGGPCGPRATGARTGPGRTRGARATGPRAARRAARTARARLSHTRGRGHSTASPTAHAAQQTAHRARARPGCRLAHPRTHTNSASCACAYTRARRRQLPASGARIRGPRPERLGTRFVSPLARKPRRPREAALKTLRRMRDPHPLSRDMGPVAAGTPILAHAVITTA